MSEVSVGLSSLASENNSATNSGSSKVNGGKPASSFVELVSCIELDADIELPTAASTSETGADETSTDVASTDVRPMAAASTGDDGSLVSPGSIDASLGGILPSVSNVSEEQPPTASAAAKSAERASHGTEPGIDSLGVGSGLSEPSGFAP